VILWGTSREGWIACCYGGASEKKLLTKWRTFSICYPTSIFSETKTYPKYYFTLVPGFNLIPETLQWVLNIF